MPVMAKRNKIVCLDPHLIDLLSKEPSASALINHLVEEHYKNKNNEIRNSAIRDVKLIWEKEKQQQQEESRFQAFLDKHGITKAEYHYLKSSARPIADYGFSYFLEAFNNKFVKNLTGEELQKLINIVKHNNPMEEEKPEKLSDLSNENEEDENNTENEPETLTEAGG